MCPSNSTHRWKNPKNWKQLLKNLDTNVCCSTIYSSKNSETTQIPINWWVVEQNTIYLNNRTSFSWPSYNMNPANTMLNGRSQTQKAPILYDSIIWKVHSRQIQRDREQFNSCQGLREGGNEEWLLNEYGASFWSNKNVPELDSGGDCTWIY